MRFSDKEVYLSVAGGMRITEPAADLAAAAALLSALTGIPVPADSVIFGEIGLSGEIRPVVRAEARLKEAEKLGFKRAVTPPLKSKQHLTFDVKTVETVQDMAGALGAGKVRREIPEHA